MEKKGLTYKASPNFWSKDNHSCKKRSRACMDNFFRDNGQGIKIGESWLDSVKAKAVHVIFPMCQKDIPQSFVNDNLLIIAGVHGVWKCEHEGNCQ